MEFFVKAVFGAGAVWKVMLHGGPMKFLFASLNCFILGEISNSHPKTTLFKYGSFFQPACLHPCKKLNKWQRVT